MPFFFISPREARNFLRSCISAKLFLIIEEFLLHKIEYLYIYLRLENTWISFLIG